MERSWLQEKAALSKFDGFRESESLSCMKPTAAPAPSLLSAESGAAPEAGQSVDAVYDPQDASADWSGFAPRHSSGRRMHAGPAAHRETIARSEEHGIVPAADAETHDSVRTHRRHCAERSRAGGGVLLGGPAAPAPEEQFTTCARAANGREPTPLELKSEGFRYQKTAGKKHVIPPYERGKTHGMRAARRPDQAGDFWAPPGNRLPCPASSFEGGVGGVVGYRARASNAPGSLLDGVGRQVAESEAAVGCRRRSGTETGAPPARANGVRAKELYATNYRADEDQRNESPGT